MKYASYGLILRLFGVFVICAHVVAGQSAVTYAMDEIGGAMLYQDSTTGRTRYSDLESGLTTDLAVGQNPAGVYRSEGYLFNSYDPNSGQQTYFYKKRSESEPAILFQGGWINYFDAETGNFVYEAYDQATMSRKVYLSKIGQTEPTMVLDLPDTWISSWSPDMSKFVYSIYDPASGTSKLRLRKANGTEDVELGPMYRNEGNTSQYANYRFVGQNGVIVKTLNIYDNDTQTNAISVSRISVTDFQNLVETPYGELGVGGNTYIVGYRGESVMTSTWNPDGTNTYRFVGGSLGGTEYVSGNSTWVISDYSSGKIGGFGDYFAFSGWDQATNQNVVELINVRTGEKTAVLRGGYVGANATYFESVPPCVGDYLTCGKPFSTTEEGKYVRRGGANGFIGYVGSFRTEQAPISKGIPGGFVGTANTNDWSDVTFANVGFFGSQLTEDWKNMFMANVGFAGTRGNMDWNDYFVSKSGYLGNAGTEDWNDVFITKSGYLGRERTWNFETEKKFAIGSFRSNWKGWVGNGKQNPQFEKPEGKDDNFLAYATEFPTQTSIIKGDNQITRETEKTDDRADPVELSTGEFTYDNTVLRLAGAVMPFELSVKYRSRITYDGPLGWNWSHSYDQKLVADEYGRMTYVDGGLQNFTFETFGDGYQYLKGLEASLAKNADGTFEMAFKNGGKKNFDVNGMLTRVEDADGNGLDLAYDAQSRLTTVTDALGRPVTYSYGQNGRISKVSDPFGRSAYFEYFDGMVGTGSTNDLASITIDNGPEAKKTVSFTYSLGGADDAENHNLLTLTDSKGQEYVRNEYYPDDRVATQWFGDGSGRFQYETADVHSDDTPQAVGSGPAVGTRVAKTVATNKRGVRTEYAFDRMGNVLSRTTYDLEGSGSARTAFEYDPVGRLLKETRPMGGGTVWKYDPNGNRTEERKKENASAPDNDLTDIVTTFGYGTGATDKLVTKSVAPDGTATRYEYDSKRRLVRTVTENVVLAAGSGGVDVVSTMEYDSLGRLFKTTDPAGRSTEFAYSGGLLVSTKKTGTWTGEILETVEYDAFGNAVKTTDGEGYASAAEYDAFGRVTLAVSPGGLKKRSAYDANDNEVWTATEVQPHVWKNVRYSYDVLDKPVAVAEDVGDGRTATGTTAYDPNGNVAETTGPDGVRKTFTYDARDRAVSWTETDGNLARGGTAEYDRDGNLVKKTDANGNAWTHSYDGFGRAVSSVSPEGTETRVAYDKLGSAVRTVVLSGTGFAVSSSSAVFNAFGKPLSVTAYDPMPDGSPKPDGAHRTAKTDYNADGIVATAYDPEGNRTEYSYDGFGRLSAVRDPLGNETRTAYDRRGLVTKAESVGSDGKTVSVSKTYGPDGRLAETRESEGGVDLVTAFEYDGLGNVTGKTDAEGRTTSYSYDFRGLVLAETDAMGNTVSRSYDLAGRKTSQTDAEGRTTSYSYGKFGTPASETLPDGSAYSWTYDLNGNVVSSSDPNGNLVETAYDREDRPVRKDALAGSGILGGGTLEYSYDAAGRLVSATGTDGKTVAYSYDLFGGILSETSDGKAVTRTYGSRGLETSITLPSGRTVSRTYDAAGRTAGISALAGDGNGNPGNGTPQALASYSYAGNFLSAVSYGNGTSESRSYGAFGRLASLSITKADSSEIRGWNYSYDKAWNPLSDGTDVWAYDPLYRLKSVTYGLSGPGTGLPSPETFAHSANGNRTARGYADADGTSSGTASYYANQLDQYVSIEKSGNSGTGSDAYSYDLNGNLVETARYRFAYDWANRLVRVTEKARTVLVGTGSERKEVWLGSETGSGEEIPPAEPPASEPPATEPPPAETPPADSGTSSGTETPPPDSGASSGAEVTPAGTGSGTEAGSGTETSSGTADPGIGSGETSSGSTETGSGIGTGTGSGTEAGTGTETPPETGTGTEIPPESGTGTESGSGTETGTGGTSSGPTETQSGATASGSTVTETTHPERLIAEYSYDALGRRVSKALADRVVTYSYDGQKIVEETVADLSGNVLRVSEFAYGAGGDDDILAEFRTESGTTATLYFLKDRLGSTAAVTDSSGSVLEEYSYSAFGSPYRKIADGSWEALGLETETLSGTVRPEPLTDRLYTGREWDSEMGLHYYRARTYSPELGRFLQRDPVGTADQMNPYAYVRNNPMMWTDPTGMYCLLSKQILHSATEQFNSEGILYETLGSKSQQSKILNVSAALIQVNGFDVDPRRMRGKNDNHIGINIIIAKDTKRYSNYKRDPYYQNLTKNAEECMQNDKIGCYFETDDGYRVYLADIGNMALAYNGAKAGLSLDYIKQITLHGTKQAELGMLRKNADDNDKKAVIERAINNEKGDQIFYEAGYAMGQMTETGKLSDETFRKYLEYAVKNGFDNRKTR